MSSAQAKLQFQSVTPEDYDRIYPYTSAFGEGSCQHSPVSMVSLAEKYGDCVCIRDDTLFTLRKNLCDETFRVYLAPLGSGDPQKAYGQILSDAAAYGKRARFLTLTERAADELRAAYPDRFEISEDRDLAEYFYHTAQMGTFSGSDLRKRRGEIHTFWHRYGDRATVVPITAADVNDILAFEDAWLEQNKETHDGDALEREARMIELQMRLFTPLHLSGVVVRIDGEVKGFGYGTKLSGQFYDAIAEKGDKAVPYIYRVLRQESVKQCAMDCAYVNMEEDVGVPGLRALKLAYRPAYLLKKFAATEKEKR